ADRQDDYNGGTSYGFERQCLCSAVPVGWQRRPEYGDPVYQRPVSGLPTPPGYPTGPGHSPQRYAGFASHHGALEKVRGAGQPGILLGLGEPDPSYSPLLPYDHLANC